MPLLRRRTAYLRPRPRRGGSVGGSGRALVAATAALLVVGSLTGCVPTLGGSPTPAPSPTPTTTPTSSPTPTELEPAPEGLEPLVPGHNRVSADRINLVFAPWRWDDPEKFRTVVDMYLGWSGGAQVWGSDGLPLDPDADPSTAVAAELGLFGMEPFRSRRDSVNVWVTSQSPDKPYDWFDRSARPVFAPDQVIVVLAQQDPDGLTGLSVSGQDSRFIGPETPARETDQPFSSATVVVPVDYPAATILVVPHELGHAMFALADEYVGRNVGFDGTVRNPFWPSCADTRERAQSWWSDQIGEYDDQLDYRAEEMKAVGFGLTPQELDVMRQINTTAYVDGGCFEVPGSVRSAEDTLMGYNFPAYGVTNRAWAEQVLDLWTGSGID